MEVDPGVPSDYFDLVFSIYGLGWTTDLTGDDGAGQQIPAARRMFHVSGEHPAYSCLDWNGTQYMVAEPYFAEGLANTDRGKVCRS